MAPTNGYCTVAELKGRLWPVGSTADEVEDTLFDQVITAVSRWIDRYCGRRFYTTASDETRYFTAADAYELLAGDVVSVTTLQTDEDGDRTYERTWTTGDYDLLPENAAVDDDEPYSILATTPDGNYVFPVGMRKGVKVVGKWGFASVPAAVKEACLIQCERIYKRKDAPFGVVGSADLGTMRLVQQMDPDVKALLSGYVRLGVF